mgnify:CR=1 FL=1
MYIVLKLIKTVNVDVMGINRSLPLSIADGMVGAIPVFKTKKAAQKSAGKKYQVLKVETKEQ